MTESPRHSGEYPEQQPQHSSDNTVESWQRAKDDARREAEAYAAAYPRRPRTSRPPR